MHQVYISASSLKCTRNLVPDDPSNPQYLICTYDALTLMQAKYIRCTSKSLTATRQKYIRCTSPMSSILHQVCRIDAVHALDSILKRIWCTSNACATHLMHLWCKKNAVYVSLMCIWCTLQVNPLMYILCASVYAVYMQSIYMACVRNDDVLLTSYLPWEGFEPTICCFGVGVLPTELLRPDSLIITDNVNISSTWDEKSVVLYSASNIHLSTWVHDFLQSEKV